ncbi:hypothetical protein EST38_g9117 [Candolleomyces aberdarensis]|uniref:BTB domain-containing protein n=1 Tax=Candolleomyces aberdarensis TaxID=2316362 RepID=A0A4V1Q2Y8_9AGAR|nr:hypothetical protein EST38_g9117 [Candolleomyces aberdarensis]
MTSNRIHSWTTVFFKVEETVFEVPRHRFIEHSEILADMFGLPQGGSVEGNDEERPIVLEGYKAADFGALVKLLYPLPAISGSYTLTKDEWVGVLNLSTRWHMKKMRDHAIEHLSKMSLTSAEKVTLARAHKVAKWLKEGLNDLVKDIQTLQPDELKAQLGVETAFRLMWIQNQSFKQSQAPAVGSGFLITLGTLGCSNGHPVFAGPANCFSCGQKILLDDPEAIYLYNNTAVLVQDTGIPGPSRMRLIINLQNLKCRLLSPKSRQSPGPGPNVDVNEVFKEEIASYESWDQ